jgi:X-Pro dipeptidyl-peptidase (S15 family)
LGVVNVGVWIGDDRDGLRILRVNDGGANAWPERNADFVTGGVRLAGTFIAPGSGGPYPAAVLVHGAGYGQRDVMRLFAESLLDAGIAALIYDKRGYGESGGSRGPTIFDQADAAAAGLDWLRAQPEVDARLAGLVGFSNGMWSVPIVAAGRSDVAFLGGIGSAGVTMAESEVRRRAKVLREAGVAAVGLAGVEVPECARQNPMLSPIPPLNVPRGDVVGISPEEAMNLLAGFRFGPGAHGLLGRTLAGLLDR